MNIFTNPFSLVSREKPEESITELCQEFMNGCSILALLFFYFIVFECPYCEQTVYKIAKLNNITMQAVENDNYEKLEELFYYSQFNSINEIYVRFKLLDFDKKIKEIKRINKRLSELGYYVEEG